MGKGENAGLKTLWEKERILVTGIFSFFHDVFYPIKERILHLSFIYFVIGGVNGRGVESQLAIIGS